ncbi:MAG: energy transducer TonB [Thiobacillus sp.]|nr:energy transducer TonB [Thiobacillus sp.]
MHTLSTDLRFAPPFRAPGMLAGVIAMHAVILGLILAAPHTPPAPILPSPIHVRLIETAAEPPAPVTGPPPPVVTPPRPPQPVRAPSPPVAVAPPTAPQPAAAPVPAVRPAEPVAPLAAPAPIAPPQPAQAPTPVVQPRFDAAYLDNPRPPYPSVSRRMGEEGEVRLRVQVDPAGLAQQVDIHQSSGFPRLDQAAQDTVRQWRFVPARQGDQPVAAWVIVPIQFTLRSQP